MFYSRTLEIEWAQTAPSQILFFNPEIQNSRSLVHFLKVTSIKSCTSRFPHFLHKKMFPIFWNLGRPPSSTNLVLLSILFLLLSSFSFSTSKKVSFGETCKPRSTTAQLIHQTQHTVLLLEKNSVEPAPARKSAKESLTSFNQNTIDLKTSSLPSSSSSHREEVQLSTSQITFFPRNERNTGTLNLQRERYPTPVPFMATSPSFTSALLGTKKMETFLLKTSHNDKSHGQHPEIDKAKGDTASFSLAKQKSSLAYNSISEGTPATSGGTLEDAASPLNSRNLVLLPAPKKNDTRLDFMSSPTSTLLRSSSAPVKKSSEENKKERGGKEWRSKNNSAAVGPDHRSERIDSLDVRDSYHGSIGNGVEKENINNKSGAKSVASSRRQDYTTFGPTREEERVDFNAAVHFSGSARSTNTKGNLLEQDTPQSHFIPVIYPPTTIQSSKYPEENFALEESPEKLGTRKISQLNKRETVSAGNSEGETGKTNHIMFQLPQLVDTQTTAPSSSSLRSSSRNIMEHDGEQADLEIRPDTNDIPFQRNSGGAKQVHTAKVNNSDKESGNISGKQVSHNWINKEQTNDGSPPSNPLAQPKSGTLQKKKMTGAYIPGNIITDNPNSAEIMMKRIDCCNYYYYYRYHPHHDYHDAAQIRASDPLLEPRRSDNPETTSNSLITINSKNKDCNCSVSSIIETGGATSGTAFINSHNHNYDFLQPSDDINGPPSFPGENQLAKLSASNNNPQSNGSGGSTFFQVGGITLTSPVPERTFPTTEIKTKKIPADNSFDGSFIVGRSRIAVIPGSSPSSSSSSNVENKNGEINGGGQQRTSDKSGDGVDSIEKRKYLSLPLLRLPDPGGNHRNDDHDKLILLGNLIYPRKSNGVVGPRDVTTITTDKIVRFAGENHGNNRYFIGDSKKFSIQPPKPPKFEATNQRNSAEFRNYKITREIEKLDDSENMHTLESSAADEEGKHIKNFDKPTTTFSLDLEKQHPPGMKYTKHLESEGATTSLFSSRRNEVPADFYSSRLVERDVREESRGSLPMSEEKARFSSRSNNNRDLESWRKIKEESRLPLSEVNLEFSSRSHSFFFPVNKMEPAATFRANDMNGMNKGKFQGPPEKPGEQVLLLDHGDNHGVGESETTAVGDHDRINNTFGRNYSSSLSWHTKEEFFPFKPETLENFSREGELELSRQSAKENFYRLKYAKRMGGRVHHETGNAGDVPPGEIHAGDNNANNGRLQDSYYYYKSSDAKLWEKKENNNLGGPPDGSTPEQVLQRPSTSHESFSSANFHQKLDRMGSPGMMAQTLHLEKSLKQKGVVAMPVTSQSVIRGGSDTPVKIELDREFKTEKMINGTGLDTLREQHQHKTTEHGAAISTYAPFPGETINGADRYKREADGENDTSGSGPEGVSTNAPDSSSQSAAGEIPGEVSPPSFTTPAAAVQTESIIPTSITISPEEEEVASSLAGAAMISTTMLATTPGEENDLGRAETSPSPAERNNDEDKVLSTSPPLTTSPVISDSSGEKDVVTSVISTTTISITSPPAEISPPTDNIGGAPVTPEMDSPQGTTLPNNLDKDAEQPGTTTIMNIGVTPTVSSLMPTSPGGNFPEENYCDDDIGLECSEETTQCICRAGKTFSSAQNKCINLSQVDVGGDCSINGDTSCPLNSECKLGELVDSTTPSQGQPLGGGGVCTCVPGFVAIKDKSRCAKGWGTDCTVVEECHPDFLCSEATNNNNGGEKRNSCICKANHTISLPRSLLLLQQQRNTQVELECLQDYGTDCDPTQDKCNDFRFLRCSQQTGKCECAEQGSMVYDEDARECVARAGASCHVGKNIKIDASNHDNHRTLACIANSTCYVSGNETDFRYEGTCECHEGFVVHWQGYCTMKSGQASLSIKMSFANITFLYLIVSSSTFAYNNYCRVVMKYLLPF